MKTTTPRTQRNILNRSGISVLLMLLTPAAFATINFSPPSLLPGTSVAEAVAVADLDNDGKLDIVVTTSANSPDRIYRNLGGGNFELIFLPGLSDGFGVAVGDLNGDGLRDIFVATAGSVDFIYRNDGDMNFSKLPLTLNTAGAAVALGQFTNSGRLDAVVATSGGGADVVYRNDGNFTFTPVNLPGTSFGSGVGVGDMSADGKLDIYVSTASGSDRVYRNTGTGNNVSFVAVTTSTASNGRAVAMGNFRLGTSSNRLEAFVPAGAAGTSSDYYGRLAGDTVMAITSTGINQGTLQRNGVASGDLNGDGTPDVFVAVGNGADFVYTTSVASTGVPTFTRDPWNGATSVGRAVALADLDGDGDLDAVVVTGGAGGGGAADLIYFNNLIVENLPDSDGDGLPDEWEELYGFNVNASDSHLDSDNDGVSNLQEYVTGSNPLNPNDRGSSLQVVLSPAGPILEFFAKRAEGVGYTGRDRYYTLECATDLTVGDWVAVPGFAEIMGDNQIVQMPFLPDKLHFRTLIELR